MSARALDAVLSAGLDTGNLDLSAVSIHAMPPLVATLLGRGVAAMTLGDHIFVTQNRYESVIAGELPVLLLHELVHVGQWRREGSIGFLVRYGSDYLSNRMIGLDHKVAYRAIGFEAAAYETSERPAQEWT
jgi:hypothetical protein